MYYRARWYDSASGRFISEDPIGFDGGINLYAYVQNDPVRMTDPQGTIPLPPGVNRVAGYILGKLFGRAVKNGAIKVITHPATVNAAVGALTNTALYALDKGVFWGGSWGPNCKAGETKPQAFKRGLANSVIAGATAGALSTFLGVGNGVVRSMLGGAFSEGAGQTLPIGLPVKTIFRAVFVLTL